MLCKEFPIFCIIILNVTCAVSIFMVLYAIYFKWNVLYISLISLSTFMNICIIYITFDVSNDRTITPTYFWYDSQKGSIVQNAAHCAHLSRSVLAVTRTLNTTSTIPTSLPSNFVLSTQKPRSSQNSHPSAVLLDPSESSASRTEVEEN